MTIVRIWFVLCLIIVTVSCAKLEYIKVPTPSQYDKWSDDKQKEADSMEGVRYYLPRPFVHLKQSVPVAQRTALVSFVYDSGAKRYKVQFPEDAPGWLKRVTPTEISVTQALAVMMATGSGKKTEGAIEEAGEPGDGESGKTPLRSEIPPSTMSAKTGFINDSDPITHLSEILDVVYLPDFEEQYAIQVKSGLGKADIETRLRNGWAAEVFSQKIDNSNLVPYVIRQVENASDAAAKVASTWWPVITGVGAPIVALTSKLAKTTEGAKEEAGEVEEEIDAKTFLGELLVFKVAEVRVAQPGLYPILKPREMGRLLNRTLTIAVSDPDQALDLIIRNSFNPWIRPDVAFIPSPPFTVVGFNATTEVFISSATNRFSIQSTNNLASQKPKDDKTADLKTKIKDYLAMKVSASNADAIKTLTALNITVNKGDIKGSRIELQNINTKFSISNKDDYKKWIKQVFMFSEDETKKVELNLKSGDTILVVAIPNFTLDQLVARLP